MELTQIIATKIASATAGKLVQHALGLGWKKIKWLPVTMFHRDQKIRVVCSAFLRIQNTNGKYLLIRNLHRPEFFAPIGGCYKFFSSAKPHLDSFLFGPDSQVQTDESAMDIRGYVRRRHIADFFEWYASNNGTRESARECLTREVKEELFEELSIVPPKELDLSKLEFRYVRSYLEESKINGDNTPQFRFFEIYDLGMESEESQKIYKFLISAKHKDLQWVDERDIQIGRTQGNRTVGHASMLLVNNRITRPDAPLHR